VIGEPGQLDGYICPLKHTTSVNATRISPGSSSDRLY
jgi:hypothetical protein